MGFGSSVLRKQVQPDLRVCSLLSGDDHQCVVMMMVGVSSLAVRSHGRGGDWGVVGFLREWW